MSHIDKFQEKYPSLESYWRSIILFGRNTASYKFSLAKSLLDIAGMGNADIKLEELAVKFFKNICSHMVVNKKQSTSVSSKFLNACREYIDNTISEDEMIGITIKYGFNCVLDAFHIVNCKKIPVIFYDTCYSGTKKIVVTDELFKLKDIDIFCNFENEIESRWNLVETAWALGISRNVLDIRFDSQNSVLFVNNTLRRKDITSARGALAGYQKGKCFYCFADISIENDWCRCDVDHFFPHVLQKYFYGVDIDGIWNLVLSCPKCNRGVGGKFSCVPSIKYLERLYERNEYLITSHHPLREVLIQQTGKTARERHNFLVNIDEIALRYLVHRWETIQCGPTIF